MAEEVTPPTEEASDEVSDSKGAPDGDMVSRAELLKVIKERDSVKKQARELKALMAQQEEAQFQAQKKKAETSGNSDEKLHLAELEIKKLSEQLKETKSRLNSTVLEKDIKSKLSRHTDYPDDAWDLLRNRLDVEQDDEGLFKPVVKANPYASVDDYLKGFFEEKPYLAKNPKKAGTGLPQGLNAFQMKTGEAVTFEQMDNMPQTQRVELQKKDPELYKKYSKYKADKALGRG